MFELISPLETSILNKTRSHPRPSQNMKQEYPKMSGFQGAEILVPILKLSLFPGGLYMTEDFI